MIEQDRTGGLLNHARWIENYPGFPGGISGSDLVRLLRCHLKKTGVQVLRATVQKIAFRNNQFTVKTSRRSIRGRILVIASGTMPRRLPDAVIDPKVRGRILYDPRRLLKRHAKTVAIIGAGDAAFDYALGLAPMHRIILLNRGSKPRCLPLLLDRARRELGIRIISGFRIRTIRSVSGAVHINARDGRYVRVDYVIPALGRLPSLDYLDARMRIRIRSLIFRHRAWMIGDVRNDRFRQTGISVGDGIRCAMEIADKSKAGSR